MTSQRIQNLTDEQLVTQFQATKDNRFFGEIYNRYYKKVYHTCLGVVKDREATNDLVQDVMIKVMENLPALQNGFLLGLWIHRIAKYQSIDYCKDLHKCQTVTADKRYDLVYDETEEEAMEAKENLLNGMEQMMNELKEEDRTLLVLKYFDNFSVEDLQNKYALSESAVKMRLVRARKRMEHLYHEEMINQLNPVE